MTTAEHARRQPRGAFAPLSEHNYRVYISGQSLASTGTWMRSIAQDWLVYSLTHSSTAVGVTMALQFLPLLLLGMHAGALADRFPKRSILLITQILNALILASLAAATLTGAVTVGFVYATSLVSGMVLAFDNPARQAFVTEVVSEDKLRAAISLNAAVFQATRLIGPAIASLMIATVGTGWVFAANALCYVGPTAGLLMLRASELRPSRAVAKDQGSVTAAAKYLRTRPDVLWMIFLVGMIGTFGLNFPIVLTAMADTAFHGNAGTYGMFNIVLGVGSAAGAVLAGAGRRPATLTIIIMAAVFGVLQAVAGLAPDMVVFVLLLVVMGFVNLICQSMANSSVQLSVDPELRGRVMGLYVMAFMGGTPIGAPIVGAITNHYGARAGMVVCGVISVLAAALVAVVTVRRDRAGQVRLAPAGASAVVPAAVGAPEQSASWEDWERLLEEESLQQH